MTFYQRQKARELERERERLSAHPLLLTHPDRDSAEAYFYGLVFAAVVNDDKVTEPEEVYLKKVAKALRLYSEIVEEAVTLVLGLTDEKKSALIDECLKSLPNGDMTLLFAVEFSFVWKCGEGKGDERVVLLKQLLDDSGHAIDDAGWKAVERFLRARSSDIDALVVCDGGFLTEHLQYILGDVYGDVQKAIEIARAKRSAESERANEDARRKSEIFLSEIRGYVRPNAEFWSVNEDRLRGIRTAMFEKGCKGLDVKSALESIRKVYLVRKRIAIDVDGLKPLSSAAGITGLLFGTIAAPVAAGAGAMMCAAKYKRKWAAARVEASKDWALDAWCLISLYACSTDNFGDGLPLLAGLLNMVTDETQGFPGESGWVDKFDRSVCSLFASK